MNFIKRIAPFEVLLVLVMMGLHLFAATADPYVFPNHWFVRDDSYYYFKVAQNIAAGYGSTFDGINMTNGYHPLWMLICIPIFALAKYDLILPLRVLLTAITVIHTATSVMLYRLVKTHLSHAVAICAAIFWSFNGYIHSVVYEMGLETPIAAFSLVLVIYLLSKFENEWRSNPIPLSRIAWLGFFSALAMFSRLDLVFFAVIIGIWIIFRNTPIRYFLPLDIAIIFITMTSSVILRTSFSSYNTVYAGSGIEVTMIALVIKSLSLYFFGAYQHPHTLPKWQMLRQVSLALLVSSLLTTGVYTLLVQIGLGKGFPRSAFLLDFLFSLILISASRLISAWFTTQRSYPAEAPLSQLRLQWKNWLREGAAYYGILGGLLLFYMIFNHFTFGTSSPVSGQIKRWWGSMGDTAYERPVASWDSYFGLGEDAYQTWQPYSEFFWKTSDYIRPYILPSEDAEFLRFYITSAAFVLLWIILVLINKRRSAQAFINLGIVPLFAASIVHMLSYTATAYGGAKEWYWSSQMILILLAFSLLFDLLLKPLRRVRYINILLIFTACFYGISSAENFWRTIEYTMPHGRFEADRPYLEVVAFLEANTFPGEVIGMTGGGNVGYFIKDRTIVNMDGLINSYEYFHILQSQQAAPYLRERGMTVIFANPRLLALPPYYGQFAPYLEKYSSYGGKDLLYLLEEPKY
ncbi:MAG: hypothetical protein IPG80_16600 [Anaerolineales bacterium]|uniref:hypothetical protein n=1 Tax=Candidatus Villigracilis vicinus TaxID=3140679 RepID=UPI0031375E79|nr:hypothetical protein [Anaerolineales bacterium]